MRTIRTKIYKFDELTEDAKSNAIRHYQNNILSFDFIYSDAEKTVDAFCNAFNVKSGSRSWLDCNTSNIDDDILNLNGLRLRKYILNNFGDTLFKRKYLKHGELAATKKSYHRMKKQIEITNNCPNKGKVSVSYYSNIQKESKNCNLTGMCYDDDMLQPIYDFLEKRNFSNCTITFYHLINDCFDELRKTVENEIDYRNTDDAIIEEIKANDYEFTENGNIF